MKIRLNYVEYDVDLTYYTADRYWDASTRVGKVKLSGGDTTMDGAIRCLANEVDYEVNCGPGGETDDEI
jgi:hypothetical protein